MGMDTTKMTPCVFWHSNITRQTLAKAANRQSTRLLAFNPVHLPTIIRYEIVGAWVPSSPCRWGLLRQLLRPADRRRSPVAVSIQVCGHARRTDPHRARDLRSVQVASVVHLVDQLRTDVAELESRFPNRQPVGHDGTRFYAIAPRQSYTHFEMTYGPSAVKIVDPERFGALHFVRSEESALSRRPDGLTWSTATRIAVGRADERIHEPQPQRRDMLAESLPAIILGAAAGDRLPIASRSAEPAAE